MTDENDEIEIIIETAISELYRGLYRLRTSKQIHRERDTLDIIIGMLMEDRDHLVKKYQLFLR